MGENGLLDFIKTPVGQGLLAATFGGLAGARRGAPLNNIGRAGLAGLTGYGQAAAAQDLKAEEEKRKATMQADVAAMEAALRGMPARTVQPLTPNDDEGNVNPAIDMPAQPGSMTDFYRAALKASSPQFQQLGMQGMLKIPELEAQARAREDERAFRAGESQAARDARAEELRLRIEDQRASQAERLAAQKELRDIQIAAQKDIEKMRIEGNRQTQQLIAANRPERMITVMGANGEPISMPQSQAQGMTPYTPAAAAQFQKNKTKTQAKEELSGVVQQLNNSYDALEKGGGITSTGRGALSNLGTSISSSGVGQLLGGAFGTENQRQRQEIQQTRPLLLNLIKEATGMSAQQMNSNAEMMLYLQAATDPTLTVEANRSALANLDRMFGLGLAKRPEEAGEPAPAMPTQDAIAAEIARRRGAK